MLQSAQLAAPCRSFFFGGLVADLLQKPQRWEVITHEPRRTSAGDPAHGCEMCDGEDVCTCPGKDRRARCQGCGGDWPECAERPSPYYLIIETLFNNLEVDQPPRDLTALVRDRLAQFYDFVPKS